MGFASSFACVIAGCCLAVLVSGGGAVHVNGSGHPFNIPSAGFKDSLIISRYLDACRALQVLPSADAIVFAQLGNDDLTISTDYGSFGGLEMRALTSLLEDQHGAKLKGLRKLDLSACRLGRSGMMLVSQMLKHPFCNLEVLDLSSQTVDHVTLLSIANSLGAMSNLRELRLHSCHLGDFGGEVIFGLLANRTNAPALERINVRNNYISFEVCMKLSRISKKSGVRINLAGNQMLDEIFNALSHGMGWVLAVVGTIMAAWKMGCDQPPFVLWSMAAYCASLNILFSASTLFHAFFALDRGTVHVFAVLDYSGIFVLIAGSYSAFLGICFHDRWWANCLLMLVWVTAIFGIGTAAVHSEIGVFQMVLYVTMGWVGVSFVWPLSKKVERQGMLLFVGGGVLYTAGLYWLFRRSHSFGIPDHTIWHLFVLAGSVAHYLCVYWYIMPPKTPRVILTVDDNGDVDMALQYVSVPPL